MNFKTCNFSGFTAQVTKNYPWVKKILLQVGSGPPKHCSGWVGFWPDPSLVGIIALIGCCKWTVKHFSWEQMIRPKWSFWKNYQTSIVVPPFKAADHPYCVSRCTSPIEDMQKINNIIFICCFNSKYDYLKEIGFDCT